VRKTPEGEERIRGLPARSKDGVLPNIRVSEGTAHLRKEKRLSREGLVKGSGIFESNPSGKSGHETEVTLNVHLAKKRGSFEK